MLLLGGGKLRGMIEEQEGETCKGNLRISYCTVLKSIGCM